MLGARLSLLVCALAVLAALAEAQSQCTTVTKGIKEKPRRLADVLLAPGEATWTVSIPVVCKRGVGITVTVCDEDVPPVVTVASLQEVRVVRHGALAGAARLATVLYCAAYRHWPGPPPPATD